MRSQASVWRSKRVHMESRLSKLESVLGPQRKRTLVRGIRALAGPGAVTLQRLQSSTASHPAQERSMSDFALRLWMNTQQACGFRTVPQNIVRCKHMQLAAVRARVTVGGMCKYRVRFDTDDAGTETAAGLDARLH